MGLGQAILLFGVSAGVVVLAGTRLAAAGDQIAERTGLGRLLIGTLLLAFATSLPELVTDITAAATGSPDLAVADLFGSSMANMAILAIIDLRHRRRIWPAVELGHARVAAVAIVLTALAVLGIHTPAAVRVGWVGVTPIAILVIYVSAVAWLRRAPTLDRMPVASSGVHVQEPTGWAADDEASTSLRTILLRFAGAAAAIFVAAPVMTISVEHIIEATGFAATLMGVVLLAITTSMPELVASLAAVKIGAFDLAVGNLFGSNAANMAVLLFADLAYVDGPILAAVAPTQLVAGVGAILLMGVAVAAIVGGTETHMRRLEPDAIVLLLTYFAALAAVGLA